MRERDPEPTAKPPRRDLDGAHDGTKKARDPARGVDFATGEAMRRPPTDRSIGDGKNGAKKPDTAVHAWRKEKDAIRAEARTKGPEDERRSKVLAASEAMRGEVEWYADDPVYGKLGCQHLPFMAAVRANIITEAQAKHLLNTGGKTDADAMSLVLEAVGFVSAKDAKPEQLYPTGTPKAGDIAVFCDAESGKTYYEHVAMFTGKGGEIMSLQANFDDAATEHPLVKTTVEEYTARFSLGEASRVVICPFPF